MESSDQEYQRLFPIFQEECREHIQKLNEGLLALERQPDEAPLDDILRSAHSLKGASRMMGMKTIETLGHYLETLLTQLIRGEKEAAPPVLEALYKGVDAVSVTLVAQEHGQEPEGIDAAIEQIQIAIGEKTSSEPPAPKPVPEVKRETRPSPGTAQVQSSKPAQVQTPKEDAGSLTTIRVPTDKLDTLINQAGELLVSKIEALENLRRIEEILEHLEEWRRRIAQDPKQSALVNRIDALSEELYNILQGLSENTHRLERIVDELHEGVRDLRLLPLSTILERFPRMVRDLSHDLGKEAELIMEGASTRLDKKILEELRDPLIHLVRNALDHGLEPSEERSRKGKPRQGKIMIAAWQEGGRVVISVSDDGKGLDRQAIQRTAVQKGIISADDVMRWRDEEVWELIFRTGFSTAPTVTEVSGRGVGLNAVMDKVELLKGSLRVDSRPGEGVTFLFSLPLTLSTTHALLFQVSDEIFCLSTDVLENTQLISRDQLTSVEGKSAVTIDGLPLAFAWLADILGLPRQELKNGHIPALLLHTPRGKVVLGVDGLLGQEEIVVKGLGQMLSRVPNLSGGTILGQGQIALILNSNDLVRTLAQRARPTAPTVPIHKPIPTLREAKKKVLVAEDSLTTRTLEKNILEAAGFDVTTAVDGEDALIKLHEKSFDIVISDVQMPRLDGFSLTERIKSDERFKEIPVILVTALQTEADKRRGIEAGADAYITKSTFDQKHLLDIIRRFI